MKKIRKIFIVGFLLIIGSYIFSTWRFQQLINEGSVIADNECLKVNPLIIARKTSFINSIKILQASGSAEAYWTETNKYLDLSKKYNEAQIAWLKDQKALMNRWDFKLIMPSYMKAAAKAQYISREADVESQQAIVELFATKDQKRQHELSQVMDDKTKKSTEAEDEYNKIWDNPGRIDSRTRFIKVPASKCPDQNFNIPDVHEFLNPKKPVNYGQPLT